MTGDEEPRRASMVGQPPTAKIPVAKSPGRRGRKPKQVVEESDNDDNNESLLEENKEDVDKTEDDTDRPETPDNVNTPPPKKRKRGRPADPNSVRAQKKREKEMKDKARREAARQAKKEMEEMETGEDSEDKEDEENEKDKSIHEMPEKDKNKFSPFQRYCDYLLEKLIAKDTEQYFMYPVSPSVAPDYNTIIEKPMDFYTIQTKIINDEYTKLEEMKVDVALISENAMKYNDQYTIYHYAAVKLMSVAKYYFGDDYLEFAKYHLPFGKDVSREILGLPERDIQPIKQVVPTAKRGITLSKIKMNSKTAEEILEDASVDLKEKLTTEVPKWDMGYVDNQDGALTLNIVTNTTKSRITLGDVVGKLDSGHATIMESYEGIHHTLVPSSFLNYEPFASFAPQYDTTWATLSKRDTELLISTYGDKENATGVMQLRQMIMETGGDFIHAFDDMLNQLTDGEHSRAIDALGLSEEEFEKYCKEEAVKPTSPNTMKQLLDEILTLKNIGIDTSFVEELKKEIGLVGAMNPEEQITRNGIMLNDLTTLQNQRFTRTVTNLADIPEPSETEIQLVNNIQHSLSEQIIQYEVPPQRIVSAHTIHDAMGLNEEEECDYDVLREFMEDI